MATSTSRATQETITALVGEIRDDTRKLIQQEAELLRQELKGQARKAGTVALTVGAGAGLTAAGSLLGVLMVARLLQRVTGLPLWACYGLVGGGLGAAGLSLLTAGASEASGLKLIPRQTAETLREDVASISQAVRSAAR
jgi:phage-related tail protein